jgi:hypothetical protein
MVEKFEVGKFYRLKVVHSRGRVIYPAESLMFLLKKEPAMGFFGNTLFDLTFLWEETTVFFQSTSPNSWDEVAEDNG